MNDLRYSASNRDVRPDHNVVGQRIWAVNEVGVNDAWERT